MKYRILVRYKGDSKHYRYRNLSRKDAAVKLLHFSAYAVQSLSSLSMLLIACETRPSTKKKRKKYSTVSIHYKKGHKPKGPKISIS